MWTNFHLIYCLWLSITNEGQQNQAFLQDGIWTKRVTSTLDKYGRSLICKCWRFLDWISFTTEPHTLSSYQWSFSQMSMFVELTNPRIKQNWYYLWMTIFYQKIYLCTVKMCNGNNHSLDKFMDDYYLSFESKVIQSNQIFYNRRFYRAFRF
jgi:hypothetical protein